jgi:ketosteroid isomerase-like protein
MKKLNFLLALFAPVLFLLPSCQPAQEHSHAPEINQDSVKIQIQALENGLAAALNAQDLEAAAAFYAPDAESMADGEATQVGIEAIKNRMQQHFASDTSGSTISFTTTGVWAAGNYATETGTEMEKDKDGNVTYTGKYMALFELRDGKYVAIRDIWNSDAPSKE